jgi:4-carboxymuconolactone decarboxylase
MTEDEIIESGKVLFNKCYSGIVPLPATIDPEGYSGITMKMFHDTWGDERLSFREKRLVVLGVLTGLGADPSLFTIHAKSALKNGEILPEELRSVILMALPYAGYPRVTPFFLASEKLLAEQDEAAK